MTLSCQINFTFFCQLATSIFYSTANYTRRIILTPIHTLADEMDSAEVRGYLVSRAFTMQSSPSVQVELVSVLLFYSLQQERELVLAASPAERVAEWVDWFCHDVNRMTAGQE